jgi:hypothetical protein
VITIRNPEQVEESCKQYKIDLAVIGYSLTTGEKRLIAAEALMFASVPSWNFGIASRPTSVDGTAAPSLITTR